MEPALVKVCRICSIMDVKLHDLRSYPLEYYYESVIGTNSQYNNLPPYACYECAALVRKFYFFRQKCLRSQAVLHGAKDSFGKVQSEKVKLIDREGIHIVSNLKIVNLPNIDIDLVQEPETNVEVKPASCDDDDDMIQFDHDYASSHSMDADLSIDDDEAVLLYIEKDSENNESDDEKVNLKDECEGLEFAVGTEYPGFVNEEPTVLETKKTDRLEPGTVKRKNNDLSSGLRPKVPSDGTCDDFAQHFDVISLTLEEQKERILKRKESSNYLNSPFKCSLCFKGFIDNDAFNLHVSRHAVTAGSIECEICKLRFRTKSLCQTHAANHKQQYVCKSCPFVTTFMNQAKEHLGWHKGITFVCKYCDETFTIWTSYMSHVRIKHPSEFICGYCGYSFVSKLGLTMHKSKMHKDIIKKAKENPEEGLYCQECDIKFISEEAYKRHTIMSTKHAQTTDPIDSDFFDLSVIAHLKDRTQKIAGPCFEVGTMINKCYDKTKGCRACGATFENSEELRLHRRKEHPRKLPENYRRKSKHNCPKKCEHCPEEFPNAGEYWTHFRRAHPDKKYPIQKNHMCDICGKDFTSNALLIYHRRMHIGERPFKCSHCDKAFTNSWKLSVHEKSHSDNRPFPCSVCFKAFKEKGALDRHFRIHTGQKPYECEICGKAFSQSNSKKMHIRTVHLKQPGPIRRNRLQRRKQGPKEPPVYE